MLLNQQWQETPLFQLRGGLVGASSASTADFPAERSCQTSPSVRAVCLYPSYRRVVRVIILFHVVSGSNSAAMRLVALVTWLRQLAVMSVLS